ncbi:MAG: hypothetical protein ACMZ7B_06130 [Balneola sp.]
MKYVPIVCLIFLQCGVLGIDDCSNGYFSLRDDIEGTTLKNMPDMSVTMGDTLWIKDSDYWENNLDCPEWGYGSFSMQFVLSDPEIAKPIILNDHIGLIPVSEGKTDIDLIGSIGIRKDGEDEHLYESLSFTLTVNNQESLSINNKRPKEVYPPFFSIKEIIMNINDRRRDGWFEIEIQTNPDFEIFSNAETGFQEGFYVAILTDFEFNKEDLSNNSVFYRNYASKYFAFPWDSSASTVYGLIEKSNPDAWDSEKEELRKNMNYYTGQFFGIRSYPIEAPVEERTFEVFILN